MDIWRDAGYRLDQTPLISPLYEAEMFARDQSYNLVSVEAFERRAPAGAFVHDDVVSVVFAIALLLLGVAGVSSRLRVSALTTGGGALRSWLVSRS